MSVNKDRWAKCDAFASGESHSVFELNTPRENPRGWTECTDFVGADPRQARVYAGIGAALAIEAIPDCDSSRLASLMLKQLRSILMPWDDWVIDLTALPTCDEGFVSALLEIANDLGQCGGHLVIVGLGRVAMPQTLRDRFLTYCRERVSSAEGTCTHADRPILVD